MKNLKQSDIKEIGKWVGESWKASEVLSFEMSLECEEGASPSMI